MKGIRTCFLQDLDVERCKCCKAPLRHCPLYTIKHINQSIHSPKSLSLWSSMDNSSRQRVIPFEYITRIFSQILELLTSVLGIYTSYTITIVDGPQHRFTSPQRHYTLPGRNRLCSNTFKTSQREYTLPHRNRLRHNTSVSERYKSRCVLSFQTSLASTNSNEVIHSRFLPCFASHCHGPCPPCFRYYSCQ